MSNNPHRISLTIDLRPERQRVVDTNGAFIADVKPEHAMEVIHRWNTYEALVKEVEYWLGVATDHGQHYAYGQTSTREFLRQLREHEHEA